MRKMNNTTIRRTAGMLAAGALGALGWAGCSSESADGFPGSGETVRITSVKEALRTETTTPASTVVPADGTYYLGYKTEVGTTLAYPLQPIELITGLWNETGLYWARIAPEPSSGKALFTLSNVGEDAQKEPVFPEKNDILWGDCTAWMTSLEFTLSHRMAAVQVELELDLPAGETIGEVSLEAIRREFAFDRQTGQVTARGEASEWLLEPVSPPSQTGWAGLLPPQARTDAMALKVVVTDGSARKVYTRKLPYSMIESIGPSQSQSIPLVFRAGHRLVLTAKVTNNLDYTVFFTGATLVDWTYKGSHGVVAKPAGIYTESELKDWTVKYNAFRNEASEKNRKALLRYGEESGGAWTFTLARNIKVTDKTTLTPIARFEDRLVRLNNYQLTGITQAELIATVGSGGSVETGIF